MHQPNSLFATVASMCSAGPAVSVYYFLIFFFFCFNFVCVTASLNSSHPVSLNTIKESRVAKKKKMFFFFYCVAR